MLSNILHLLGSEVKAIYGNVHCLAEIITDGAGKKQPKIYDKEGQLLNASDFDNYDGLAYFRHDGDLSIQHVAIKEITSSCSEALLFEYPMKFVGGVRKNKFQDNAFTDDAIILNLIALLDKKHIIDISGNIAYEVVVNHTSTDSVKIISEEYSGFNFKDFNYNLSYIAVYFTLRIGVDKRCLPECVDSPFTLSFHPTQPIFVRCCEDEQIDQTGSVGTYGVLLGAVDNVNTIFTASANKYKPGSGRLFQQGQLLTLGVDWIELNPVLGQVQLTTTPFDNGVDPADVITFVYKKV